MKKHVMVADVLGLSDTDPLMPILRASENALAAVLRLLADMPGVRVIEDTYGFRFFNMQMPPESTLFLTRWPRENADVLLDAELTRIESMGLDIDWNLFGPPSPPDLPDRLLGRGLTAQRNLWLVADFAALPPAPPKPPELRIVRVDSDARWDDWQAAFERGFNSEHGAPRYRKAYAVKPLDFRGHRRAHHVGYVGARPVVCSSLLVADGHATFWDIATAPDHRRRGYGAAIVRQLVDEAIQTGCRTGSLNSSALGRSMYMALGFERVVDLPEYHWSAPARMVGAK